MQKNKRLRVFAGQNGSTLFQEFQNKYDSGFFINADNLEKELSSGGLIDLGKIGLKVNDPELAKF